MRTILMIILTVGLTATLGAGAVVAAPGATDATASAVTADADQSTAPET